MPRAALGSIGIPLSMPPGPPGTTAGVALTRAAGNAEPTLLNAGAADAQLCGTESGPRKAARPAPAVTSALPIAGALKAPVPEPTPLPSVNPNIRIWLVKTPAVGATDRTSELAEPIAEMPKVDIDADEPTPEARLVPEVSAVDDDARVVNSDSGDVDDEDDIDEAAEASPGSTSDAAVVSGVDSTELSEPFIAVINGATVCAAVPAKVLVAWATAAAIEPTASTAVISGGAVNGVNVDAVCAAA
jgi:hypothetical protein